MSTIETPLQWQEEIDGWRLAMQAMRLSPETIAMRVAHVRRLARTGIAQTPWDMKPSDLLAWVGQHSWRRETARAFRSSIRRFWAWAILVGRTSQNTAEVIPMVPPEAPRPRPADPGTVAAAIRDADTRVGLMMRLANELGLRRGEVARVRPENDLLPGNTGWSLVVHGKGSRHRVLPLPADLAEALDRVPPGYLFPSPRGGHLSPHWVGALVSRALGDGTTMHQLRHLCATEVHDQTKDIRLVQTLLGHASLATTERYVAVDSRQVRDAIEARSRQWSVAKSH